MNDFSWILILSYFFLLCHSDNVTYLPQRFCHPRKGTRTPRHIGAQLLAGAATRRAVSIACRLPAQTLGSDDAVPRVAEVDAAVEPLLHLDRTAGQARAARRR